MGGGEKTTHRIMEMHARASYSLLYNEKVVFLQQGAGAPCCKHNLAGVPELLDDRILFYTLL